MNFKTAYKDLLALHQAHHNELMTHFLSAIEEIMPSVETATAAANPLVGMSEELINEAVKYALNKLESQNAAKSASGIVPTAPVSVTLTPAVSVTTSPIPVTQAGS